MKGRPEEISLSGGGQVIKAPMHKVSEVQKTAEAVLNSRERVCRVGPPDLLPLLGQQERRVL